MQDKKHKKAFTLVELIIVITILAILATIAFISFEGYSKQAKDSALLLSLKNIGTGLDIYKEKTGNYPEPDNAKTVTLSGGEMFSLQGIIGTGVVSVVKEFTKVYTDVNGNPFKYAISKQKPNYAVGAVNSQKKINLVSSLTLSGLLVDESSDIVDKTQSGKLIIPNLTSTGIFLQQETEVNSVGIVTSTGTQPTVYSCTGNTPTGSGVVLNSSTGGLTQNKSWTYKSDGSITNNCEWKCDSGYTWNNAWGCELDILNQNLLGYWNFNNGDYSDKSGNLKNFTLNGNPVLTEDSNGLLNNAYTSFNNGSYFYLNDFFGGNCNIYNKALSISFWFYPGDNTSATDFPFLNFGAINVTRKGGNSNEISVYGGQNNFFSIIVEKKWNNIILNKSLNSNELKIYINGIYKTTAYTHGDYSYSNCEIFFGRKYDDYWMASQDLTSKLDELRIFSKELDISEINEIVEKGVQ